MKLKFVEQNQIDVSSPGQGNFAAVLIREYDPADATLHLFARDGTYTLPRAKGGLHHYGPDDAFDYGTLTQEQCRNFTAAALERSAGQMIVIVNLQGTCLACSDLTTAMNGLREWERRQSADDESAGDVQSDA